LSNATIELAGGRRPREERRRQDDVRRIQIGVREEKGGGGPRQIEDAGDVLAGRAEAAVFRN
jgi:hypothetical protein